MRVIFFKNNTNIEKVLNFVFTLHHKHMVGHRVLEYFVGYGLPSMTNPGLNWVLFSKGKKGPASLSAWLGPIRLPTEKR